MSNLHEQLQKSLGNAYVVERELGGGGMSRVFVAHETSLGRNVVVKVLPAEFSNTVSMARFRRETSLAAQLQHPHIVPMLTAGETDGLPYYIMPFVEGESLRAKLSGDGMPVPEVASIARDVAQALEYAHAKGVTHRDIKPDNVLLVGGSAMITDFGVARSVSDAAGATGSLTSAGIAVGTPAYMAPEQAAADPSTDSRADIYAFGIMVYEMLAGYTPFAGRGAQATLVAHAVELPTSILTLRRSTPPLLADLVMRCLEKRPADRPQTASEIVRVLDTVATNPQAVPDTIPKPAVQKAPASRRTLIGAAAVGVIVILALTSGLWWRGRSVPDDSNAIRSIAVLPFDNTSGDTTYDYLEDGITDHVRDALNEIPGLTVKARSSSRQLMGHDVREIANKLGVALVLEGTVRPSASRLHVTTELVRAADDASIWSSTFDVQASELAGIQDTIERAIVGKLGLSTGSASLTSSRANGGRGTRDIEAYDLFLRARHAFDNFDFIESSKLLKAAVKRDPGFARARAYLAASYANETTQGIESVDSLNALASASVTQALALDPNVAEAYLAEASVLMNEMRLADAVVALQKAASLDSTDAVILTAYGSGFAGTGRVEEGLAQLRRARAIDPLSVNALGNTAYLFGLSRRYGLAISNVKAALDMDPKNVLMYQGLGFFFAFSGKPDSAVAAFETAFRLDSTLFGGRSNLVFGYAAAGRWNDAARERALLLRERGGNSPMYRQMVADIAFGDYDAAMSALERAVLNREALLGVVSIPCDPLFDPLKSNPRFDALMKRLGARTCPATGKWPIGAAPRH